MRKPSITDHLSAALHNWSVGKRQDLKDLVAANPNILAQKGHKDVRAYFVPLLYIRELCQDLMSVGFPVEDVFNENRGDFLWVDWPEAVAHVSKYKPSLLRGLCAQGALTGDTIGDLDPLGCYSPDDDENTAMLYDHWPRIIQEAVRENSEEFVNSENYMWEDRHEMLMKAVEKLPTPSGLAV